MLLLSFGLLTCTIFAKEAVWTALPGVSRYLSLAESRGLALWVSCFEIYGGKLYDLLNGRQQLVMREDGKGRVCIVGLKEVRALSASDSLVMQLMCVLLSTPWRLAV